MKYEINGIKYTKKQLENILSGETDLDSQGNVIFELQDAALEIMEQLEEE